MSAKAKDLIFEEEARDALRRGIDELVKVVGVTLGPRGRHVGLDAAYGAPQITNDGNSIAASVELKDQYENMGASIGKEVATKMKEKCGDGTTTSLVLLGSLVEHGVKAIAAGASPILVKRGMEKAITAIVQELEMLSKAVKGDKEIRAIATAAASGAEEVGILIAQAFENVGRSGVISIEEAKGTDTIIEMVEGMQFDRGYLSSYFCTNTEKMTCELTNPRILITDKKISSVQEFLPLLKEVAAAAQELLIIADDLEGDALSTLVINRIRGTLKICAVKAPGFGDKRKEMLKDIAILTGATLISEETGDLLKDADSSALGGAEKVVISKETTTLINGEGADEAVKARIAQLQAESERATSAYDAEKIEERKAKLSGGVAVIRVGAPTEPAMKQKKQLFEDSLSSTKAALEEGIVIGGSVALLQATSKAKSALSLKGDEQIGADLAFSACEAPFNRLVQNSGYESPLILERVIEGKGTLGFNVFTGSVEEIGSLGINDPLKVVRSALAYASSAAGMVLLSECLVGEASEDEEE